MALQVAQSFGSVRPHGHCRPVLRSRATVGESLVNAPLKTVKLGTSDLRVTEVCLGCMMFGSQNSEKDAHSILDAAFDSGVNFLDTSEAYPIPPKKETAQRTSQYVGSWLKKRNVKREDIIIATKVAGYSPKQLNGYIAANRTDPPSEEKELHLDAQQIKAAAEGELRRLGVDYIDLFQTHWPDRYKPSFGGVHYDPSKERDSIPFEEQVAAMGDLIKEGKIRYWGLSNESSYGTTAICLTADQLNCPRPISIQNSFSLVDRRFESELAETCCERHLNLPLLPWSPAAGGVLSGKYLDGKHPKNSRMGMWSNRYSRFLTGRMEEATAAYVEVAKEFGYSPIQLAYLFCKSRFFVASTIIGATSLEQLEEDLVCFNRDLPPEALQAIDAIHAMNPNPQNVYT